MAKAQHRGECQVCGATQKLPSGRLAPHGYTVRWGFFQGVCHGSHQHPFETHHDLLDHAIQTAQNEIARIRQEQQALRTDPAAGTPDEPLAWVHEYCPAERRGQQSSRIWRLVPLIDPYWHEGKLHSAKYLDRRGTHKEPIRLFRSFDSLVEMALHLNHQKADALNRNIQQLQQYIEWQQGRINSWQPRDLQPVQDR